MYYLKRKGVPEDTAAQENNVYKAATEALDSSVLTITEDDVKPEEVYNNEVAKALGVYYDPLLEQKLREVKFSVHNPPPDIDWKMQKYDYVKKRTLGVAGAGETVMFYGPPKCRKSFIISSCMSSLYTDDPRQTLGFKLNIKEGQSIIHFDTEMPEAVHWKRGLRLNKMCKYGGLRDIENYHMYNIRLFNPHERVAAVEQELGRLSNVGIIVLDQLGDMVPDINDRMKANELLDRIALWGSVTGALVISTLHVNWSSEKMTGVIGTEIGKKMSSGFFMEGNVEEEKTKVTHLLPRDETCRPFEFKNDENGFPYLILEEDFNF